MENDQNNPAELPDILQQLSQTHFQRWPERITNEKFSLEESGTRFRVNRLQIERRFMGTELDTLLRSQHPILRAKLCTGTHRAKRIVDGQERPGGRT